MGNRSAALYWPSSFREWDKNSRLEQWHGLWSLGKFEFIFLYVKASGFDMLAPRRGFALHERDSFGSFNDMIGALQSVYGIENNPCCIPRTGCKAAE